MSWIPVTERLPVKDGPYLVLCCYRHEDWVDVERSENQRTQTRRVTMERWCDIGKFNINSLKFAECYGGYRDMNVTHWMPLPDPPEECHNG
jgi:hypothetical protein